MKLLPEESEDCFLVGSVVRQNEHNPGTVSLTVAGVGVPFKIKVQDGHTFFFVQPHLCTMSTQRY